MVFGIKKALDMPPPSYRAPMDGSTCNSYLKSPHEYYENLSWILLKKLFWLEDELVKVESCKINRNSLPSKMLGLSRLSWSSLHFTEAIRNTIVNRRCFTVSKSVEHRASEERRMYSSLQEEKGD